ncbi:outer membrane beta-barrel protein, partial [Noviherbaspirillum denitrificans]|uniref:outer membrane beta-barrel protein n=1 Tax=Noviherbaspirillum denitrificans TaxID=1968433 RepID=UPI00197CCAB0
AAAPAAPYSLFGDALEHATGIKAFGFLQLGLSSNNVSTHNQATGGHSNFPVVGPADEGLQTNALQLALERPIQTNILPRITPLPGPMPWEGSFGFRAELLYGRNGLPAGMLGYDADWGVNRTPAGVVPGSNRQNYLAMPQVYAQYFFPVGMGVALTAGRFGAGVGHEIPPEFRPGPNFFYSKTYAFVAQPDQVAGALLSANLMNNELGLLAGELGVVNGRQNWKDNNDDKSIIGALRWRSGDMNTWVDYSFMRGNEQNDPNVVSAPQMPIARIISPRGQLREHHSLSVSFKPLERWKATAELLYGKQHGDGLPGTIDVLTFNPAAGNFFSGASYSGANVHLVYAATPSVQYGIRLEKFRDRGGVALFPVTAVAGDFNAVTLGARWDINPNVVFRPEIRHDWQSGNRGVKAFGASTAERQTTLSADVVVYF